ncbi:hypothetical protein B6I21_09505 [candidate division KSB1 bacterium 4572_119]|nr:MAG: hypothetical protein B6I21_09505 [candidate division KSB1 bacterium 4572_119]
MSTSFNSSIKKARYMIGSLGGYSLIQLALDRLFSINHYYVMKVNLKRLSDYPLKRNPSGELSLLTVDDLTKIKQHVRKYKSNIRREILARIQFYERGFHNCYVMKIDNKIAYFQWLIYPNENENIRKYFKRTFYSLQDQQVMIENAFTFPEFRGRGYLPYVSRLLLNKAKNDGYKSAIGYIKNDKITSLNEFFKMDFKVIQYLREVKLAGRVFRNLKIK